MSRIVLCVGNYANTPYWLERSELNLYSMEELCFYIRENVVLIDKEFMNMHLVDWIAEECNLPGLGQKLASDVRQKVPVAVFVDRILNAVHYCSKQEILEINKQMQENADMNNWEKRKSRIDFYAKSGRYSLALKEYENLRKELNGEEKSLSAKISHNIATLYADMYIFDMAAENYLRAYREENREDYFFAYLAAKRMMMSDKEYVDFVAQEVSHYDISLQLEKTIENLNVLWEEQEEKHMLDELQEWRSGQRVKEYYETVEQLVNQQKDSYREHVLHTER